MKIDIKRAVEQMNSDLAYFERKYQGKFLESPHVGLGNRKTRCVNEATLPIVTCHPSCLEKCAGTCYVLRICTIPRPNCRRCEARNTVLRRIDPAAYYEHFFKEAERLHLPIRLSDGGDFENKEQVEACFAAARRHPTVNSILYTKRVELLEAMKYHPANVHVRYSSWEGDEENTLYARSLGYDVTYVVWDGSGNCPYQRSLARFLTCKRKIAQGLREQGVETKVANRRAEQLAAEKVKVWHCRNCSEHGTGCCGSGDIKFNVVGQDDWAVKAEQKRKARHGEPGDLKISEEAAK